MPMAKMTNPMGRHHSHRADGVRAKSCRLQVEELLLPHMSCLHDACKSIACCFLWIFRHPRTSLLIDSMNACRMTHASHTIQLGHLFLSSCLTHRRLPVARMSELPCTAINKVYTLPPAGESRGRLHGTT